MKSNSVNYISKYARSLHGKYEAQVTVMVDVAPTYRHFADDTFKCIFLENFCIGFKCYGNMFARVQLTIIRHFIQIMAWCRTGDKPLSDPIMASFGFAYMRLSASIA